MKSKLITGVAGGIDRAFTSVVRVMTKTSDSQHVGTAEAIARAAAFYASKSDAELFPSYPAPTLPGDRDVTWYSTHVPLAAEAKGLFQAARDNRYARARLYLAGRPRPALVVIHGYLGGGSPLEERTLRVEQLFRSGFDVALPILPFHGPRALAGRRMEPPFPSADPWATVEGVRQGVADIDALVGGLLARGAPYVGVAGVSLGGYLATLHASVSSRSSFLAPVTPLASFSEFAKQNGTTSHTTELDALHAVIDPLAREPRLTGDRAVVVVGRNDHVTPRQTHGDRIAARLRCDTVEIPGGHIFGFGFDAAWETIAGRMHAALDVQRK